MDNKPCYAHPRLRFLQKIPVIECGGGWDMYGFDCRHLGFRYSDHSLLFWDWPLSVVLLETMSVEKMEIDPTIGPDNTFVFKGICNFKGTVKGVEIIEFIVTDEVVTPPEEKEVV
jgi:hypothetical protein